MALDIIFWDRHYQSGDTGWDMGQVSPPLKEYIDQLQDKQQAILIPGAGNSYEAQYLLQQGFTHITVVDIAPTAIARLKEKTKEHTDKIKIIQQNFFQHSGKYDLILEQTFFCAIDPGLRHDYAAHVFDLLNNNGRLVGLLFNKEFDRDGPPFGGHEKEYKALFASYFSFHTWAACYNSYPPRAGSEWFMILRKKDLATQ